MLVLSCGRDEQRAKIVLDGELTAFFDEWGGHPAWRGFVKNTGDKTAYNCVVEIRCYRENGGLIDIALGFPEAIIDPVSSGPLYGAIKPGDRCPFEAVASHLESHEEIDHYKLKISWTDQGGWPRETNPVGPIFPGW